MQQTWYANGTLWGAPDTAVQVGGELKAGIAWFAVDAEDQRRGQGRGQGQEAGLPRPRGQQPDLPGHRHDAVGKGAIAFTVMGQDYYPSAGYARIDATGTVGPIHIAAEGLGPDDGFTSYKAFVGDPPRTRWGDYGAAVTDGNPIWLASEYIAADVHLAQYLTGRSEAAAARARRSRTGRRGSAS